MNQCDGCARGLPLKDGIHLLGEHPLMSCTKALYDTEEALNGLEEHVRQARERAVRKKAMYPAAHCGANTELAHIRWIEDLDDIILLTMKAKEALNNERERVKNTRPADSCEEAGKAEV